MAHSLDFKDNVELAQETANIHEVSNSIQEVVQEQSSSEVNEVQRQQCTEMNENRVKEENIRESVTLTEESSLKQLSDPEVERIATEPSNEIVIESLKMPQEPAFMIEVDKEEE